MVSLRAMLAELLRKKIWSKLLVRQPLTARMNSSAMVGRIHWMVIFHILLQRPAPSNSAASYSPGSIPEIAAR